MILLRYCLIKAIGISLPFRNAQKASNFIASGDFCSISFSISEWVVKTVKP
jgi:hypothetical protein